MCGLLRLSWPSEAILCQEQGASHRSPLSASPWRLAAPEGKHKLAGGSSLLPRREADSAVSHLQLPEVEGVTAGSQRKQDSALIQGPQLFDPGTDFPKEDFSMGRG